MSLYFLSRSDSFAVRRAGCHRIRLQYASPLNALRRRRHGRPKLSFTSERSFTLESSNAWYPIASNRSFFGNRGGTPRRDLVFSSAATVTARGRDRGEEMENRGLRRSSPLACPKDGRASSRPHDRPGCNRLGDIGHTTSNSLNDARLSPARNPALPPRRPRYPRPSPCSSRLCLPRPRLRPLRVSARRRAAPRCWR